MSGADVATAILLVIVVFSALISAAGVLLAHDAYERLHFVAAVATVGVWALAAAVLIKESLSQAGIKIVLIALLVCFANSVLTHATARAARVREHGDLRILPEEKANRPEPDQSR